MPCNYSGWLDARLVAQFGVVSFDWANHENSWRSRASDINPASNDTLCALPHPPPGSACVKSEGRGETCCFYPDEVPSPCHCVRRVLPALPAPRQ